LSLVDCHTRAQQQHGFAGGSRGQFREQCAQLVVAVPGDLRAGQGGVAENPGVEVCEALQPGVVDSPRAARVHEHDHRLITRFALPVCCRAGRH
jgi:hypothetical protein